MPGTSTRHAVAILAAYAGLLARADHGDATDASRLLAAAEGLPVPCSLPAAASLADAAALVAAGRAAVWRVNGSQWPEGLQGWADPATFLERHGGTVVDGAGPARARSALSVANGGSRRGGGGGGGSGTTLAAVLNNGGGGGGVVFVAAEVGGGGGGGGECAGGQAGGGGWLASMRADLGWVATDVAAAMGSDALVLSVAAAGSGLPRHTHGPAWLALAAGAKFWVLRPPAATEGVRAGEPWASDPRPPSFWLAHLAAGQAPPAGVQWCVQHPRDVLFLPAYWHHATLNLAGAGNAGVAVAVGGQQNKLAWADHAHAAEGLQQLLDHDGANPRLLEAMADNVVAQDHPSAAAAAAGSRGPGGSRPAAALMALPYLLAACHAEPLNVRLSIKTARLAKRAGRRGAVSDVLRAAVGALAALEAAGGASTADVVQAGGELGVAVASLAKEHAALAVPLLARAAGPGAAAGSATGADADLVYHLAYAHGSLGHRATAKALLARVLELDPGHADARTIHAALS